MSEGRWAGVGGFGGGFGGLRVEGLGGTLSQTVERVRVWWVGFTFLVFEEEEEGEEGRNLGPTLCGSAGWVGGQSLTCESHEASLT